MADQMTIDGGAVTVAPEGRVLTARQQSVWDLVRNTPGGVTADEVGAMLHAGQHKHGPDERCNWCASTGMDVLRSVALRPLVVRRRVSGMWEPRERQPAKPLPALPDETWEDLF